MTARALLVLSLAATLCLGCGKWRRPSPGAAAPDGFRPPAVELPTLAAPQPLPAARALHLFYTANVVGDLEPCG